MSKKVISRDKTVGTKTHVVHESYVPTEENTIANPKPPKGGTGTTKKK